MNTPKKIESLKLKQLEKKIKEIEKQISEEETKAKEIEKQISKEKEEEENIKEKKRKYAASLVLAGPTLSENEKKEIIKKIDKLTDDETNQIRKVHELIKKWKKIIMHEQSLRADNNKLKTEIDIERSMIKIPTLKTQLAHLELKAQLGTTKTKKGGKYKKHKKTIHKKHKKTIHKKHKKTNHKKHKKTKKV